VSRLYGFVKGVVPLAGDEADVIVLSGRCFFSNCWFH